MNNKYEDIHDACLKISQGRKISSIVDLGARYGEGYERMGKKIKHDCYTFVEPSVRCLPRIKKIIDENKERNLRLIEGVLGIDNCETNFFQLENDNDQSGNLFTDRQNKYGGATLCKVKVFDYRNLFSKIDLLKCNIEGGEYDLIEQGFFEIVENFVMEVHNYLVPGKNYLDALRPLSEKFDIEIWGDVNYKYCFMNGTKKDA